MSSTTVPGTTLSTITAAMPSLQDGQAREDAPQTGSSETTDKQSTLKPKSVTDVTDMILNSMEERRQSKAKKNTTLKRPAAAHPGEPVEADEERTCKKASRSC